MSDAFIHHICAELGYAPEATPPGRLIRFPTSERASDDAGWAKLFPDELAGVYGDHRTGARGTWFAEKSRTASSNDRRKRAAEIARAVQLQAEEQQERWARQVPVNRELWAEADEITTGDAADLYLSARGLRMEQYPACLRLHSSLEYWQDGKVTGEFPAILASMRDLKGKRTALQRIYLDGRGGKAPVPQPKKLTKSTGIVVGSAVWLQGRKRMGEMSVLGVAEGVETALACFLTSGVPTVAAYSAKSMASFQWPAACKELIVFADNDGSGVGQEAGQALAARAKKGGLTARVLVPEVGDTDWADVRLAAMCKERA